MPISINGTTASVTGLTNGTSYRFRVAARNAVGLGPYTAATTPGTPSGDPDPPPSDPPGVTWTKIEYTPAAELTRWGGVFDAAPAGTRLYDKGRVSPLLGVSSSGLAVTEAALKQLAPRYSTNGTAWTQTEGFTRPFSPSVYEAWIPYVVLYGTVRVGGGGDYNTYVAVGTSSYYSQNTNPTVTWSPEWAWATDGASWTRVPGVASIGSAAWKVDTACYDGWRFTASCPSPVVMLYSVDGVTWQARSGAYLAALCGGLAFYKYGSAFTGSYGTTYFAGTPESSSPVPDTLLATNLPLTARPFYGEAPAGSIRYIATTEGNTYYTSTIGADATGDPLWTERTLPAGFQAAKVQPFSSPVAYGNGHWLMLARPNGFSSWRTLLRSTDAITWTPVTTLPVTAEWRNIFFFGNYFYASSGLGLWRSQ